MIRWIKLKELTKKIVGINDVEIHLSTKIENAAGYFEIAQNKLNILLNAHEAKTEYEVVVILAHEISEYLCKKPHSKEHNKLMRKILRRFSRELNLDFQTLMNIKRRFDKKWLEG